MNTNNIAVLPLGAQEYHGPHLPLETDSLIAEAFAGQIKARLPSAFPAHFLPVETIGYSREHMRMPGSKTLSYDEAIEKWLSIAAAQHKQGVRKFIMLNAHGGNSPLMTIIATELRARFDMLAVSTSLSRFGLPEGLLSPAEKALDIHGGFIETSIMLAIAPEKVHMEKAQDFANAQQFYARKFTHLRSYGPHAFGWLMQDINPLGAAGAAARATPQAGRQILAHAAKEAVKLFTDVEKFDLSALNAPAGTAILALEA
ncbi:MAG: creatininase family protein [Candidatus Tokpelaia sp.]|nr:MAG: creatininase family protein [Candidatus Tokpelaia sp.]KAA6207453.1 MAG: creatininase family protein [Candidatus Tokpelaia sp.]